MMPLSRRLDWVITKSKCVLSAAGSAQIMTMGRRVGIERKEGGKVESRTRKKSRMEKGEVNGGGGCQRRRRGESWWQPASAPDCKVYCMGKMVGSARPPNLQPPPPLAPISASFSLSASHTLLCFPREPDSTAGLIKLREAERQKKDREGKRGHTTGRHQSKLRSFS